MGGIDSYTKLLIRSNTTDGSTTFADISASEHTVTGNGTNIHHEDTQKKIGTTSIQFNGSDDYLSCADNADWDFGSGDWTIDCWVYPTANETYNIVSSTRAGSGQAVNHFLYVQCGWNSGYISAAVRDTDDNDLEVNSSTNYTINTWQHICLCRNGNTVYLYKDGTNIATLDVTGETLKDPTGFVVGTEFANYFEGYIDEFRVSKGIDRTCDSTDPIYNGTGTPGDGFTPSTSFYPEDIEVAASTATLILNTNAVKVGIDLNIIPIAASLTVVTNIATIGVIVETSPATLAITVNTATISYDENILALTAPITITSNAATISNDIDVTASMVALTITANAVNIEVNVINVWGTTAALTLTEQAATISWNINISATSQALTITPYDAVVWDGAAWNAWLSLNYEKVIRKYTFTLTGEDDGEEDIDIPFSSFQCRRRDGEPTYLSVVIKDIDYSSAIAARSNGDMKITMSYIVNGESVYEDVISIVDLEDIQLDRGGSNQSISLTGHRTISYTPKSIELRDVTYYRLKDGKYVYRCAAPDLYLAPGDTATHGDVSFIVDQVQYTVSVLNQMMQVKEA